MSHSTESLKETAFYPYHIVNDSCRSYSVFFNKFCKVEQTGSWYTHTKHPSTINIYGITNKWSFGKRSLTDPTLGIWLALGLWLLLIVAVSTMRVGTVKRTFLLWKTIGLL